ncbi:MAG: hypothetical protein IJL06_11130 [Kiritimatiellae bacterium]|nr:hypothetical protein [Kiritimatiellia bacterium]
MVEDVYEPLDLWRRELRDAHRRNVAERFEALVAESGVDEAENKRLVAEVRRLEKELAKEKSRLDSRTLLRNLALTVAILAAAAVAALVFVAAREGRMPSADRAWTMLGGALVSALFFGLFGKVLRPAVKALRESVARFESALAAAESAARAQMEPLNRLFDWNLPAEIAHKTLPRIEFDPFFTAGRLRDLRETFGLDDELLGSRSVLGTASGEISGNPFVLADTLAMRWTTKTYHGSLHISWTETRLGADGKLHREPRSETLHASVDKPCPVFENERFLLYGNPAAPDLRFSRLPSPLSGREESRSLRRDMEAEERRLEKRARKLDPAHPFTLMANRDFEVLFHAVDRDHPIQFRLLFTPLAQAQMVTLLRDRKEGYGDDFAFRKDRMVNRVDPAHLREAELDTRPERFRSIELAESRRLFNDFCNDWFKHLYFSLAPLLCVPLYQQTRTHETIYRKAADRAPSAPEHESIANYHGEEAFRHPDCATRSLLKAALRHQDGASQVVEITAHGFRAEERVDYVEKRGGDGFLHDVPVKWTEYLPVERTSPLHVLDAGGRSLPRHEAEANAPGPWRDALLRWNPAAAGVWFHRATVSRRG